MTGGALALLMATVFLLLLLYSSVKAENDITCIRNYGDLKDALLDRETDNERLLLDTFYPPSGESIVHFVNVLYCISDNKTKCSPGSTNYTYYWADSRLLLVIEPYLLNALTLTVIKLHVAEVTLTISPPFCSNDTEANLQLLNTLTVWLKKYATMSTENQELVRGIVRYYEPGNEFPTIYYSLIDVSINILIPFCLLAGVVNVFLVLSFRVCSRKMAKRIDKAMRIAISTATSGLSAEESKSEETPCLEVIASPAHNVFYILAIAALTILDVFVFLTSPKHNIVNWFTFLPVPLIAPVCFCTSALVPTVIKCITCTTAQNNSHHHIVHQIATVALLTVLSAFAIFHGFWVAVMFAVYPTFVLSKALPLIPMYLPILIIYRKIPYLFEKCHKFYQNRGQLGSRKYEGWVLLATICYTIFIYTFTWLPVLALIDYTSNELIILAQLGENPLQLMLIVAAVTLITYRLSLVFVEVNQDEKEEEDKVKQQEFELTTDGFNNQTNPSDEAMQYTSRVKTEKDDKETISVHSEGNDNDTIPIPFAMVK